MKSKSEYNGIFDCLTKTVKNEGPLALYKGFTAVWLRLAPWQIIFWLSYEKLRKLNGTEAF